MGSLNNGHLDSDPEDDKEVDLELRRAVRELLEGMGEDSGREGLRRTPLRVSKSLLQATRGYRQKVKDIVHGALFPEVGLRKEIGQAGGAGGLVVVRDLDLFSYCESCLLPFRVKCHIGYIPSGHRVLGLSKLSRVADVFAKRLQHPQRLADEIASALHDSINPAGVAVTLECSHIYIPNVESIFVDSENRGWLEVVVSAGSGVFEDRRSDAWIDFVNLRKSRGPTVNGQRTEDDICEYWCPLVATDPSSIEMLYPELTALVTSIIRSLGENPVRKELAGTPARFLKWLMNFQNASLQIDLGNLDICPLDPSRPKRGENGHTEHLDSELNLPFCALCEHHLLPFHGVVHIGYIHAQGSNPPGRSLLQSIVHFYGFKLQLQEKLTRQIAETVSPLLGGNIMVVVEASHCCMISRGIEKIGSSTATVAVLGRFSSDASLRAKFFQSIRE
ncbi:hypothetical protein MLD38_031694 [Melastoma candidum]|uniref:Uncharacterized protein n=1 Tax=Melastoma candidum TaxID=119954 RepID=A0ACB9MRY6_9MYRT|nr:hypothetical protein MLD38_031694 [Melastoma candidum]